MTESYTSLKQSDEDVDNTSFIFLQKRKLNRPYLPYIYFGSGCLATLALTILCAISYKAFHRTGDTITPAGLIPDFPRVAVEFKPHPEFSNLTDPISTQMWSDVLHQGHIFVEDASRYSLKPGIPISASGHGERMIVSGLHAIHCLRTLRTELTIAMYGHATKTATTHHVHNHAGRPDHCFDYIRQVLMCNLDLTYESARVDLDGKRRVADGWGTIHQCKDWSAIDGWILENRELEYALDDFVPPDPNKPPGQDEIYGEYYPVYNKSETCN